ncbi:SMP-30/gluconolactonase/LRE family protein [Actinoplanes sp. NPDC049265]|uniref:SMP-30/gluconolactonase/LRE family protein n=1 Tax=Actinoplanes sp. NPDC049265 TaxID=3363902 RepID=UPI0037100BEB
MFKRTLAIATMAALAVTAGAVPASASQGHLRTAFDLPAGFQPEGIAIGKAPYAYLGSRADGDIYRVNLESGRGKVVSEGPGTPSLGFKLDRDGRLFVAGGTGGDARVIDSRSGRVLKSYTLQTGTAFINDVTLAGGSAWFTDSANPNLHRVKFGRHGALPGVAKAVPLTGDIVYQTGNNANGIAPTPDGRGLIIVQSNTGLLFRTSWTGVTRKIDTGGVLVTNGDGLWLRGRSLYVVQNRDNKITEIKLDSAATRGTVVSTTTSDAFDVPTTIAEYAGRLYLPNARFTTPAEPTTPYNVTSVRIP